MRALFNSVDAVIFDMDGVLVDTEPIHMMVEQSIFKELGIQVGMLYHQTFIGRSSKEMWADIINNYGLKTSVQELVIRKRELYMQELESMSELPVMPGVKLLLESLQINNKKLALASSSAMPNIRYIISRTGLEAFFQVVVSGDDLPRSKPDPAIFLQAADFLDAHPSSCIVIEDASAGVQAARSAGMKCVGLLGNGHYKQDISGADLIISQYAELMI
jgi:beta-phosphoglucomutase